MGQGRAVEDEIEPPEGGAASSSPHLGGVIVLPLHLPTLGNMVQLQ